MDNHTSQACMSTQGRINELQVTSDLLAAKQPEQEILESLESFGYPEQTIFAIKLALEEAIVNAIKHGNQGNPAKHITVRYDVNPARTVILVADQGGGFCLDKVPDCTAEENIYRPCGRGIMLMRAYMDKVRYCRNGTVVRMVKYNRTCP